MAKTVFYAWQSELPNRTNRGFIRDALKGAIKQVNNGQPASSFIQLDEDTRGVAGAPDIAETILAKIDAASVFVGDLSLAYQFCSEQEKDHIKWAPNPNVIFELGYAVRAHGRGRVLLIINEAFGHRERLPFDIRGLRSIAYRVDAQSADRPETKRELITHLASELCSILQEPDLATSEIPAEVQISYERVQGNNEVHVYDLKLCIKNKSDRQLDHWTIQIEFPDLDVLMKRKGEQDTKVYGYWSCNLQEFERGTPETEVAHLSHSSRESLRRGETRDLSGSLNLRYRVTRGVCDATANMRVHYRVLADGKWLPLESSVPFSALHEFPDASA